VERLLDVARLRIMAESAGIASLSREEGQLVVRFPPDWSRADAMRAMAPAGPGDRIPGVPPNGVTFATNQLRVRLPHDTTAAWTVTRAVVERLTRRPGAAAALG
jgi:hypothetical protein